ncbi:TMEM165/GDT1 family protein [Roseofilum capinflatum]|uniref:GDT1 family protein n=1 Tax=Roseofilum capinflatum BLCC-M114 TaxID=3022440 RepID=A0ABT7BBY2_9CYAN|nr:TMEM165/GDT1 family protein [Roseofilum capinflatum]MDJ1176700.1 TMEM165/GDT1 family protein [Roseofilum capinflatum BLCC-M114]
MLLCSSSYDKRSPSAKRSFIAVTLNPPDTLNKEPDTAPKGRKPATRIFLSTFITIFLAEIGDKTQVTTLLMTAESHSPWIVFLGAGSALVLTSFLGVWVGQWLASHLTPRLLDTLAGTVLLVISVALLWDMLQI